MITVTVESTDKELIRDIWSLKSEGIELEEIMLKTEGWPGEITAYIELASASLVFIPALLGLVVKHKKPSTTKTIIKTSEVVEEIKGVTSRYEKITHVEIHEEH
jgi:hypothetical protein